MEIGSALKATYTYKLIALKEQITHLDTPIDIRFVENAPKFEICTSSISGTERKRLDWLSQVYLAIKQYSNLS